MFETSALIIAGSASRHLAGEIAAACDLDLAACTTERFPDGEVAVSLEEGVRTRTVVVVAATAPPVNDHLVELLAITDACRRADAARIVAVVPYFGYARSDRRDGKRTPIMASLVADLFEQSGIAEVITTDVHTPALEGFFRIPLDNVTATGLLAHAVRPSLPGDAVIVAPDLGAVRLANRYAMCLDRPVAVCHKRRLGGSEVSVSRVTGDVVGRRCLIVDDMISTGGTIREAVRAVRDAGAHGSPIVAASHAVFAPGALDCLRDAGVGSLFVTNSIEPRDHHDARLDVHVVSVGGLLGTAVRHLLAGGSLRELA